MAYDATYGNALRKLITEPGSYAGSPGYEFARDQGLNASLRANSAQRGSGNVLAELTRLGTGYAAQDYGNQVDRLGRLAGQEQQYDLGQTQNANAATRNANDFSLGTMSAGNTRRANDQNFGLGMYRAGNDYTLGSEANANTRQRNFWDANTNWFNAQSADAQRTAGTQQDWWRMLA